MTEVPAQPSDPEPPARRSVWMWVGGLVGLVLAVSMFFDNSPPPAARTATIAPSPSSVMLAGAVVLGDSASFTRGAAGGCGGTGALADVVEGALVLLRTTDGDASGILTDPQTPADGTCRFSFRLAGVPTGQDTYEVTVAEQEPRTYAEPELAGALAGLRLD